MAEPPRVFFDADALIAGAASTTGAAHVLLRLCEFGLLDGRISRQVYAECDRNLRKKLPQAVGAFERLVAAAVQLVPDPSPEQIEPHVGMAHPKDLPIWVASRNAGCRFLVTFNARHFRSDPDMQVVSPGDFLARLRGALAAM